MNFILIINYFNLTQTWVKMFIKSILSRFFDNFLIKLEHIERVIERDSTLLC